ncbi:hypothetical protein [Catellatospora sp. TT07R-123]|uniref:hypothetical protein n=1 Tax=Catellatospora sp. TT07R-123 TaxID=2733863 RepID=UPI001BB3B6AC|nr:hypothetical protein [Catellatospora sp. TT07R-123]
MSTSLRHGLTRRVAHVRALRWRAAIPLAGFAVALGMLCWGVLLPIADALWARAFGVAGHVADVSCTPHQSGKTVVYYCSGTFRTEDGSIAIPGVSMLPTSDRDLTGSSVTAWVSRDRAGTAHTAETNWLLQPLIVLGLTAVALGRLWQWATPDRSTNPKPRHSPTRPKVIAKRPRP